jgi:hypothetical protein
MRDVPDTIVSWSLAILCLCLMVMVLLVTGTIVWKVVVSL